MHECAGESDIVRTVFPPLAAFAYFVGNGRETRRAFGFRDGGKLPNAGPLVRTGCRVRGHKRFYGRNETEVVAEDERMHARVEQVRNGSGEVRDVAWIEQVLRIVHEHRGDASAPSPYLLPQRQHERGKIYPQGGPIHYVMRLDQVFSLRCKEVQAFSSGCVQPGIGRRLDELSLVHALSPSTRLRFKISNQAFDLIVHKLRKFREDLHRFGRPREPSGTFVRLLPPRPARLDLGELSPDSGEG